MALAVAGLAVAVNGGALVAVVSRFGRSHAELTHRQAELIGKTADLVTEANKSWRGMLRMGVSAVEIGQSKMVEGFDARKIQVALDKAGILGTVPPGERVLAEIRALMQYTGMSQDQALAYLRASADTALNRENGYPGSTSPRSAEQAPSR